MATTEIKVPSITVTPKAVEKIHGLMAERGLEDHYLRILVDSLGCSGSDYGLGFSETPREEDIVLHSNGVRIAIDPISLMCVKGATVDFVDTPNGPDFKIDNPNEVEGSACGSCGHNCNKKDAE